MALRPERGFSLLELVVVIVLISVLLAIAIERLLIIKAQAERTAKEQVLGNLRSATTSRLAEMAVRSKLADIGGLARSNPMKLLAERPQNYLGELFGPDASSLEGGNWYFDSRAGVLCYLVESVEYFETRLAQPPRACYVMEVVFEDINHNGQYDPGTDQLRGLRLATMQAYAWNIRYIWSGWWGSASTGSTASGEAAQNNRR